jgi:RNA polymerase sigma-70 factor (ECF subfamily)
VIKEAECGHEARMKHSGLTVDDGSLRSGEAPAAGLASEQRLRIQVEAYYDFVWRSLRRLGVASGDVDDTAQLVFVTMARKLGSIRPGAERSFLFQTAMRVAADNRRTHRRRREVPEVDDGGPATDRAPTGEELLDLRRARVHLDKILDAMPDDLRAVFVLFEIDQLTMAEIAQLLDLAPGTVASRLRRARVEFRDKADLKRAHGLRTDPGRTDHSTGGTT